MDFFAHQEAARRRTGLLVGYYVVAVALILCAVYFAFALAIGFYDLKTGERELGRVWDPTLFAAVTGGTLLVVLLGTLYKTAQLRAGGAVVARMLGGRPVAPNTRDPAERRIQNVVEEMAVASGTPVPQVFVLDDEPGINAFAAGHAPADAVVAVTRGSAEQLTRDELQGVVAHEFSHILNGDMRLNIRLLGVLHGILVIALTGYWIFRVALESGGRRSRSRQKGSPLPLALLGLLLMVIGYVGVFFGKLIKSAVSRQREFLADASAVQFTRNPDGITGALRKIGGWRTGSRLQAPRAEEASHFYFANGLASSLLGLFATHPPLVERIRRIDPSFDGELAAAGNRTSAGRAPVSPEDGQAVVSAVADATPERVVARVGAPGPEHLDYARRMVSAVPPALGEAAREASSARSVVYALLLSDSAKTRAVQSAMLGGMENGAVLAGTEALNAAMAGLAPELTLPLLDIAVSALRGLSRPQYDAFMATVDGLVRADNEVDLFEYALRRVLARHLAPAFGGATRTAVQYYDLAPLLPACAELLSCLAYWGSDTAEDAAKAYAAGAAHLGVSRAPAMAPADRAGLSMVDSALDRLAGASPAIKRRLVAACAACVGTDGRVTVEEGELLRAVADSLDCPIPPFLPS